MFMRLWYPLGRPVSAVKGPNFDLGSRGAIKLGLSSHRLCNMDSSSPVEMKAFLVLVVGLFVAAVKPSGAVVYKVGDSIGWTILNSPNYTAWATGKTFHVGDTLLFEYNKQYHNVMQISEADYTACINTSPINTWTSGNDSIPIKSTGHHYYLCGVPSHCQIGQKVDIPVVSTSGHSNAAPPGAAPKPSNATLPVAAAPAPKPSGASATHIGAGSALAVAAITALYMVSYC